MALPAWLSTEDLLKFRTRFCERFLIQGECSFGEKCQYSHNLLWRRRSPQKFSYMPIICPDIITWVGNEGRRHVSINWYVGISPEYVSHPSRNGKNCNHAHSREEILYHPTVYKTSMCETWNCARYYCPFAHSMDELVNKPPPFDPHADPVAEEQRLRQLNLEDFWEDNDFDESLTGGPAGSPMSCPSDFDLSSNLQMRRVIPRAGGPGGIGGPLISTTTLESSRIGPSCLQSIASSFLSGNNPDPGWLTITQGLRVELIVRAISPLTSSELCLGTARAPWESAASSGGGNQNRRGQQQASMVVKVVPISDNDGGELVALTNQLQSIARADHKNILAVKKVHLTRFPDNKGSVLAIAYERCSTSLYTTIADGYRSLSRGGGLPRGLAGRMSPGRSFTATSAATGKIGELLSAIHRFHSMGMTHCRICPSNIFIDADANLKLGDFDSKYGLLRGFDNKQFLAEPVAVWAAPEVTDCLLEGGDIRSHVDWKKADVFSAGMCIFLALTGQHPFGTFADDDRLAAAGAAANCRSSGVQSMLFVEGKDAVIDNMRKLNFVNQHLLYGSPLLLDLVMRMLVNRTEVGDLLAHPLFWDFYGLARFITRLPADDSVDGHGLKALGETCPVPWTGAVMPEEWKLVLGGLTPMDFKDTAGDLVRAIRAVLSRHKASGCGLCSSSSDTENLQTSLHHMVTCFVNRMASKFPAMVVRIWDASRLAPLLDRETVNSLTDVLMRNHLSWMNSRPRPMPQPDGRTLMLPSHSFVREYYLMCGQLAEGESMKVSVLGPDESPEILASIVAMAASGGGNPCRSVDPSILSCMLNSFGAMMRSDMLPPNVPKSFVVSLIEAAGSTVSNAASPSLSPSPSPSCGGVYYSTVLKPHLPSGATTATSSPSFVPLSLGPMALGSPLNDESKTRRGSSCDGWEYAVACPPTMTALQPRISALGMNNPDEEDESPPPGFQSVWQSMADDGL